MKMYYLKYSNKFKKDLKKLQRQNRKIVSELEAVLKLLVSGKELPARYKNHKLQGEFNDCYECHIRPDILLIYKIEKEYLIILLLRIGSHPELFG